MRPGGTQADAIVNAANERMLGGGGVDGAIHRAAGPGLREECERRYAAQSPGAVRCPVGEARITAGHGLPARHVVHTVGPVYKSAEASAPMLAAAYRSCLRLANAPEHNIATIAFPALSCGAYGYPVAEAADIAVRTCQDEAGRLEVVDFVLFTKRTFDSFDAASQRFLQPSS